jgi:uncharacterized protein
MKVPVINVGAILAGTVLGLVAGTRLTEGIQQRVLAGLALVTLVIGVENALEWRDANVLHVLGGVLLGGIVGELLRIEDRLQALGDRLQRRVGGSRLSEGFFTASLLFCVGPLAVIGSVEDGLRGEVDTLATKATLDGFASIALAAALGIGVAFSALTVLLYQGALTLGAGLLDDALREGSEPLAALTSAGGILIIGISLRLADIKDVKVGNFLPALVIAPTLAAIA